jgi:hypothetical protein
MFTATPIRGRMFRGCIFALAVVLGLSAGTGAFGQMAFPNEPNARAAAPPPDRRGQPPDRECFNRQEQRMAVNQGFAIRLSMALRSITAHDGDELLRAQLCRRDRKLVYVLTLLSRNGKVSRAMIDARSGEVIKDR